MEFRIGRPPGRRHAVEGERLYGDGVNIAARLEGLAEPGGICISDDVRARAGPAASCELDFDDLGEQSVKNIPDPVHVLPLAGGARVGTREAHRSPDSGRWPRSRSSSTRRQLPGWSCSGSTLAGRPGPSSTHRDRRPRSGASTPKADEAFTVPGFGDVRPAIAVLPFENLSGDPEQEYFADGIAEDLITRLSGWRSFPVIARNSSFVYKGSAVDVKQVSRELGVRYVVEGSVRKAGGRVRINVQLIDATTGHHVWAETYDRDLSDVFAVQDEITQAIVGAMQPEIMESETERAGQQEPQSFVASDHFWRGLWHVQKGTAQDNAAARRFFEQAIELAPQASGSYGGLAIVHTNDLLAQWTDDPARSLSEADAAARRCMDLAPDGNLCNLAMSLFYQASGQRDKMIASSERRVRLYPSSADAYSRLGEALALAGRPEAAIANLEKAMRLSPKHPGTNPLDAMTWAHFAAGRYEQAVDWAEQSLERHPHRNELAYRGLAASYGQLGRLDEARAAVEQQLRIDPELSLAKVRSQNRATNSDFLERWLEGLRKAGLPEE